MQEGQFSMFKEIFKVWARDNEIAVNNEQLVDLEEQWKDVAELNSYECSE